MRRRGISIDFHDRFGGSEELYSNNKARHEEALLQLNREKVGGPTFLPELQRREFLAPRRRGFVSVRDLQELFLAKCRAKQLQADWQFFA